jgi:hypothetical protein
MSERSNEVEGKLEGKIKREMAEEDSLLIFAGKYKKHFLCREFTRTLSLFRKKREKEIGHERASAWLNIYSYFFVAESTQCTLRHQSKRSTMEHSSVKSCKIFVAIKEIKKLKITKSSGIIAIFKQEWLYDSFVNVAKIYSRQSC